MSYSHLLHSLHATFGESFLFCVCFLDQFCLNLYFFTHDKSCIILHFKTFKIQSISSKSYFLTLLASSLHFQSLHFQAGIRGRHDCAVVLRTKSAEWFILHQWTGVAFSFLPVVWGGLAHKLQFSWMCDYADRRPILNWRVCLIDGCHFSL